MNNTSADFYQASTPKYNKLPAIILLREGNSHPNGISQAGQFLKLKFIVFSGYL